MRRMLTDKLTKSIKEVVNAYNEGEFSTVTANPETTTETLTSIEIDGTGYTIDSGTEYTAGTGIDITNDTISVNNTIATKNDIPTNYVTTDTTQDITGEKTFIGNKRINFKQSSVTNRLGFTGYDTNDTEIGYLEMQKQDTSINGANSNVLGYYSSTQSSGPRPSKDPLLGFKYQTKDSTGTTRQLNLMVPTRAEASTGIKYIPISVNGETADNTGNISLSIPDAVSGTNDGTNWTSLTIGNDTYDIPQGGGGQGKLRLSYTNGPTAATEEAINAWLLNMPFLAFNSNQATILINAGFTDVHTQDNGTEFEIQGYIGIIKDDGTLAVITTEKRTGTSSLVNKTNTNIIPTMKQVATKDFMITDARFRGYNTSLSTVQGVDPLNNAFSTLTVCSIALIAGYQPTVTADSTKNFVLRQGFTISINNPDPDTYQDQLTPPTTDGTYTLKVTVTNGLPTFNWVLDQA